VIDKHRTCDGFYSGDELVWLIHLQAIYVHLPAAREAWSQFLWWLLQLMERFGIGWDWACRTWPAGGAPCSACPATGVPSMRWCSGCYVAADRPPAMTRASPTTRRKCSRRSAMDANRRVTIQITKRRIEYVASCVRKSLQSNGGTCKNGCLGRFHGDRQDFGGRGHGNRWREWGRNLVEEDGCWPLALGRWLWPVPVTSWLATLWHARRGGSKNEWLQLYNLT
jgi:hypothetical protein